MTKFEAAAARGVAGAPRATGLALAAMAELMQDGDPSLEVTLQVNPKTLQVLHRRPLPRGPVLYPRLTCRIHDYMVASHDYMVASHD